MPAPLALVLLALAAQPQWEVKVVGSSPDAVLLHLEQPLVRGEVPRLYLASLVLGSNRVHRVEDMYLGLGGWSEAHPQATDAEWKAEATRVRGQNWNKVEKDLRSSGYGLGGAARPIPVPSGWKTFDLPQSTVTLTRECETCEVFAVARGKKLSLASSLDLVQVFVLPRKEFLLLVERQIQPVPAAGTTRRLPGLWVVRKSELSAAKEATAPAPGTAFVTSASPGVVREEPSPAARGLGMVEHSLVKILGPVENEFVKVRWRPQTGPQQEGWLQLRYVLPPVPELGPQMALLLEGGIVNVKGHWRYRVSAKNPGEAPVSLEGLTLGVQSLLGDSSYGGRLKRLDFPAAVPAKGELLLIDAELQRSPAALVFLEGGPITVHPSALEGAGTLEHTVRLEYRGLPVASTSLQRLSWPLVPALASP